MSGPGIDGTTEGWVWGDDAPKGGPKQEPAGVPAEGQGVEKPGGVQGTDKPGPGDGMHDRESGSNGFALSGFRTASGNTELYINPHVPFYFRMEVQLVSDEGLNTYGAVTWGQFFVYQGFNAHCGWMHTSSLADVADLYAEKVQQEAADGSMNTRVSRSRSRPGRSRSIIRKMIL
jgi:acyl-homoserine lactone acylase PvdQ